MTDMRQQRAAILEGRSKSNVLRLSARDQKRCRGYVQVSVGEDDILFLRQPRRRTPSFTSCVPTAPVVLHRISFDDLRKVSITRFSSTAVILTLLRRQPGAGCILLYLSECVFKPQLNQEYSNSVVRFGGRNNSKRSSTLPLASTLYYREPMVECVHCREKNKLSDIRVADVPSSRPPRPPVPSRQAPSRPPPPPPPLSPSTQGDNDVADDNVCIVCLEEVEAKEVCTWTACGGASDEAGVRKKHWCCRSCLLTYLEVKGVEWEDRKQFVDAAALRKQEEEQWVRKHDWEGW